MFIYLFIRVYTKAFRESVGVRSKIELHASNILQRRPSSYSSTYEVSRKRKISRKKNTSEIRGRFWIFRRAELTIFLRFAGDERVSNLTLFSDVLKCERSESVKYRLLGKRLRSFPQIDRGKMSNLYVFCRVTQPKR